MIRAGRADKNSNEALTAQTKHAGLLDIETDTNPIERGRLHTCSSIDQVISPKCLSTIQGLVTTTRITWRSCLVNDDSKDANLPVSKMEE
ncbi:unnamed protein product [Rhodiola kirilowii]